MWCCRRISRRLMSPMSRNLTWILNFIDRLVFIIRETNTDQCLAVHFSHFILTHSTEISILLLADMSGGSPQSYPFYEIRDSCSQCHRCLQDGSSFS